MGKWLFLGLSSAIVAAAVGLWVASSPQPLSLAALPAAHEPDIENGRRLFHIGGCASCHAAPDAEGEERLALAGGLAMHTPVGTFHVPNISMHESDGIGAWTDIAFANAVLRGISPDGSHYFPSFPYMSFARMTIGDVLDLKGFIATLPAVASTVPEHDLLPPFSIRRGLGIWKRLYLDPAPAVALGDVPDLVRRGQYLADGPGHCGECHTPRNRFTLALDNGRWLRGGVVLEIDARGAEAASEGGAVRQASVHQAVSALWLWLGGALVPGDAASAPDITGHSEAVRAASTRKLVSALSNPRFGKLKETIDHSRMRQVQQNLSQVPKEDIEAIAAYLQALAPDVPAR